MEQVLRIPDALELPQPLVLRSAAEGSELAGLGDIAADRVDVDAARRPGLERCGDGTCPVPMDRILCRIGPLADHPDCPWSGPIAERGGVRGDTRGRAAHREDE